MSYQSILGDLRTRVLSKDVAEKLNVSPRRLTTALEKFVERVGELPYSYFTMLSIDPLKATDNLQAETLEYLLSTGKRMFTLTVGNKDDMTATMIVNEDGSRLTLIDDGYVNQAFEDVISYNDTLRAIKDDPKEWLSTIRTMFLSDYRIIDTGASIIKHGAIDEWIDSQLESDMFKDIVGEDKEIFAYILNESISVQRTACEELNILDNVPQPSYYFDDVIELMMKSLTDYTFNQLDADVMKEVYAACLKCYANDQADGESDMSVFDEVEEMIKDQFDIKEVVAWPYIRAEL